MALIDDTDIQTFLPVDKFLLEDVPDDVSKVKLDVERIIRGRLSGTFSPTTLADWASPGTTPQYIRAIGGRLAAALLYSLRLAEDFPDEAEFARRHYRDGLAMLELVANGLVTLPEVTEEVDTGRHLSTKHYTEMPEPKFAMDREF